MLDSNGQAPLAAWRCTHCRTYTVSFPLKFSSTGVAFSPFLNLDKCCVNTTSSASHTLFLFHSSSHPRELLSHLSSTWINAAWTLLPLPHIHLSFPLKPLYTGAAFLIFPWPAKIRHDAVPAAARLFFFTQVLGNCFLTLPRPGKMQRHNSHFCWFNIPFPKVASTSISHNLLLQIQFLIAGRCVFSQFFSSYLYRLVWSIHIFCFNYRFDPANASDCKNTISKWFILWFNIPEMKQLSI